MFNEYVWQIYLNAGGKEIVSFFEKNLVDEYTKEYANRICEFHKVYCPTMTIIQNSKLQLEQLHDDILSGEFLYGCYSVIGLPESENLSANALIDKFYDYIKANDLDESQVFEEFSLGFPYYTTFLGIMFPDFFIPYYFAYNFNIFENIAQEFDIVLPPLPVKKDYKGRFYYYSEICAVLCDFRKKHNLSPCELCAFLYDFAPKYIGGVDSYIVKNDLPKPKSAYFIGADKSDAFLSNDSDIITPWQCSPETKAGDMIVMYLRTPISAVDSIWRSVSIGFNDPFFYYYRCTYIANPVKIKKITQKELQNDSVFKELPIVKKNMQGINGVELYPSVYNHLLDMADANLPRFSYSIDANDAEIRIEKDVEEKKIKPFLKQLGYTESDWVQQLQIRVGNHNFKLIPDFIVKPIITNGHHSAFFHIEAKYSISTQKELEEVKIQARSYAKQLGAPYSVIASKEGIWISTKEDDYTKDILSFTWAELNNEDAFYSVLKTLGKK